MDGVLERSRWPERWKPSFVSDAPVWHSGESRVCAGKTRARPRREQGAVEGSRGLLETVFASGVPPTHDSFERLTPLCDHLPSIHHLLGFWCPKACSTSLFPRAISAHPRDAWMGLQPLRCSIGQTITDLVTFPVNEECPLCYSSTTCDIIQRLGISGTLLSPIGLALARRSRGSGLTVVPTALSSRAPGSPPLWRAKAVREPKRSPGGRTHKVGQWLSTCLLSARGVQAANASHPKAQGNRLTADGHITWTALGRTMKTMRHLLARRTGGLFCLGGRTTRPFVFGGDHVCHRKAWE